MIWLAIIAIWIIPPIWGFLVNRKRAFAGWVYCPVAAFLSAATFTHYQLGDTSSQFQNNIALHAVLPFIVSSVLYWSGVLVRLLSRWHAD